jgi:hypothetical protein
MHLKHPVFQTPGDDVEIWRYMTWTQCSDMLVRSAMFFARPWTFQDPLDSSYPEAQLGPNERWGNLEWLWPHPTDEQRRQEQAIREAFIASRETCAVSCWYLASTESDMHWYRYGGGSEGGVAIRSNIGRLVRALEPYRDRTVKVGTVKYIDFEKNRIPTDNGFRPVVHKQESFNHDREVRAVIWETESGSSGPLPPFEKGGVHVSVDLSALIDEIVVSPHAPGWFAETVLRIFRHFGLTCAVRASTLLAPRANRATS